MLIFPHNSARLKDAVDESRVIQIGSGDLVNRKYRKALWQVFGEFAMSNRSLVVTELSDLKGRLFGSTCPFSPSQIAADPDFEEFIF